MKRTLLSTALVLSGLVGTLGLAQKFEIPETIAIIDGKPLTKVEFQTAIEPMIGVSNLDFLQSPQQLNELIVQYALQNKLVEEAKKEKLDSTDEYKKFVEHAVRLGLSQAYIKKAIDDIKITDQEIKDEYEKQVKAVDKTEYQAAHILVETEKEAKDILAKMSDKKNPLTFDKAAKEFSLDPGSKENGGDLGWFRAQVMVPEFGEALKGMKKGDLTDKPVKTQFGYHIIKLEDVRETPIDTLEDSKDRIKESLTEAKLRAKIEGIQQKIKIEYKVQ